MPDRAASVHTDAAAHADRLKERIYLAFTALAVLITLRGHEHIEAREALTSLALAVAGTLAAVIVAEVIAHLVAHERLTNRAELRHILNVATGALGGLTLPFLFLGLAAAGVWKVDGALKAATWAVIVALIVIGYLAVRRAKLPWWQRVLALVAEAGLAVGVVALELLAHG